VTDVVIVGYGPTGAVLANLLGQAGVDVTVVEPTTDVYHLPRAAHFDDEVMRVFQSVGLAASVLPATTPVQGMDFLAADGTRLFGFDAGHRPRRHGWESGYMFHQPDLERALRAGVERFANVTVHLGWEAVAVSADGVVEIRQVGTGEARMVRARYVVGCDGARSLVRRAIGATLDDHGFDQPWLVVDTMLVEGASPALPERVLQICDPGRPVTFVPSAGAHRRWEFMAMGSETAGELLDPAKVAQLLAPWVEVGRDVEVARAAVYSFHALVADRWRRGPLLIAGDAAHQMPPFLGQGMCAGIRDAANLWWKLAMVLDGRAGEALLDTYQSEREPHVRAIIDLAVFLGGVIQTTDPAVAAVRDEQLRGDGSPPAEAGLPPLGPGCFHGSGAGVGRPFPQVRVGDDDALGPGFSVVHSGDLSTIVRPDRYVFAEAVGEAALAEATAALEKFVDPAMTSGRR